MTGWVEEETHDMEEWMEEEGRNGLMVWNRKGKMEE